MPSFESLKLMEKRAKEHNQDIEFNQYSKNDLITMINSENSKSTLIRKQEDGIQYQKTDEESRVVFELMLKEVYPLKLRLKIKREWLSGYGGTRQSATILEKYPEAFRLARLKVFGEDVN